uniref:Putative lipocalin-2 1 n=1 Tax=Amblyomma americanum TaxID=6943 RepID=A0A0C9R6L7_AMBAM
MGFLTATAVAITRIFLVCAEVEFRGASRMAIYEDYFEYQNISKALDTSDVYWLYSSNFDMKKSDKDCVYFKFQNVSEHGINFYSGYKKNNESGRVDYTGIFYSLPMVAKNNSVVDRNTSNAVYVNSQSGLTSSQARNFSLIFSHNRKCLIFLVLTKPILKQKMPANLDTYENRCIILLRDSEARIGINATTSTKNVCQNVFYNACIKYNKDIFRKLFSNTCSSPEIKELPAC